MSDNSIKRESSRGPFNSIRQSCSKIDGAALLDGRPVYTDDLAPADALVVKVLRSPHAFARIRGIKKETAEKVPGVVLVLGWQDVPRIPHTRAGQCWPEMSPCDTYILDEYVRHVGDAVAIVAASDEGAAERALRLIKVDYEILEPLLDFEKAVDSPIMVHPEKEAYAQLPFVQYERERNIVYQTSWGLGDVEGSLAKCPIVLKRTYRTQAQAQAMMESQRAFTHLDTYGRLVVVASTQIPFHVRRILSMALNLPMSRIRVVKPRLGGGFGAKQTVNAEFFPALVTLLTGRPAKIVYTRKEVFTGTNSRHEMRFHVTLGADHEGQIRVIEMEGLSDTGAYGEHASTTFSSAGGKTLTLYNKVEACRFSGKAVYTNRVPGGALRGFGVTQGIFALESAINELAAELGIDPLILRKKNMIHRGETTPLFNLLTKNAGPEPILMEGCYLDDCVRLGSEDIGWQGRKHSETDEQGRVIGYGMAITQQGSGLPQIDMASATLKLNDDGFFTLLMGATDMGQGSDTILAQIAAETLGTPMEQVVLYTADTDVVPYDSGAYASSTTYTTGHAVIRAAEAMHEAIITAAAELYAVPKEAIEFDGERVLILTTGEAHKLRDFARKLTYSQGHQQLSTTGSYVPEQQAPPYMAGFVKVAVDLETGEVEVLDFSGAVDCGTPINPKLCVIQAEGGIATGIGLALYEEARYTDKGKLIQNDFMSYKLPTRRDMGNIRVTLVDGYEPSGPYGAKSIGEVVVNTPAPAICAAIYDACGIWIRSLPATPEKVWKALAKKNDARAAQNHRG